MRKGLREIGARQVEAAPGKLLVHLDLAFADGAIGTAAMGTVQSRTTPMEFVQVMADGSRIEVANVETVTWHRDPGFKIDDAAASLAGPGETRHWQPNLTAAKNEDPKGYAALLQAFVARLNDAAGPPLPDIEDGTRAMHRLEAMIRAIETGQPQPVR